MNWILLYYKCNNGNKVSIFGNFINDTLLSCYSSLGYNRFSLCSPLNPITSHSKKSSILKLITLSICVDNIAPFNDNLSIIKAILVLNRYLKLGFVLFLFLHDFGPVLYS
jgi:hypothetical protein